MNNQLIAAGFFGVLAGLSLALPLGGIAAPASSTTIASPASTQSAAAMGALLAISPASVRVVKQVLNRLGYSAGPVTGAPDRQLSVALREFEAAHGLEPTGTLTVSAIAALGLWNRIVGDPLGNGRKAVESMQDLYGPGGPSSGETASSAAGKVPSQRVTNEVPGGGGPAAGAPGAGSKPAMGTSAHRAPHGG